MLVIASLIKDRAWILPEFIRRIEAIHYPVRNTAILMLDDASKDNSRDLLHEWGTRRRGDYGLFRILHSDAPFDGNTSSRDFRERREGYRHLATLRNLLFEQARAAGADLLLSVDSDILVTPRIIDVLSRWKLPMVAAMVLNDNSKQEPFLHVNKDGFDYDHLRGRYVNFAPCDENLQFQHRGDYPLNGLLQVGMTGACFLADSRVIQSGAVYGYHPFGEDAWFCLELRERGISCYADTGIHCVHVMETDQLPRAVAKVDELCKS